MPMLKHSVQEQLSPDSNPGDKSHPNLRQLLTPPLTEKDAFIVNEFRFSYA